jgi:hypothetical protein
MWKSAGRVPSLRVLPGMLLTTEEKARKNLSHGKKSLSQVKKDLNQSTVYILPKHAHITKPTHTHTYTHIHTHTYTHTYTHIYTHIHTHIPTHIHTHIHTHTHTHITKQYKTTTVQIKTNSARYTQMK